MATHTPTGSLADLDAARRDAGAVVRLCWVLRNECRADAMPALAAKFAVQLGQELETAKVNVAAVAGLVRKARGRERQVVFGGVTARSALEAALTLGGRLVGDIWNAANRQAAGGGKPPDFGPAVPAVFSGGGEAQRQDWEKRLAERHRREGEYLADHWGAWSATVAAKYPLFDVDPWEQELDWELEQARLIDDKPSVPADAGGEAREQQARPTAPVSHAIALLATNSKLSVAEIARAVGVNRQTMYRQPCWEPFWQAMERLGRRRDYRIKGYYRGKDRTLEAIDPEFEGGKDV